MTDVKKCSRCHEVKPLTAFSPASRYTLKVASLCKPCNVKASLEYVARNKEKVAAKKRAWQIRNKDRLTAQNAARNLRIKSEVMSAYGGSCACCGETELVFLSIDHVDGRGAEHRRESGHGHGRRFYEWLRVNDYPRGFQVLCFNCNWAKSHGGCPHRKDRRAVS